MAFVLSGALRSGALRPEPVRLHDVVGFGETHARPPPFVPARAAVNAGVGLPSRHSSTGVATQGSRAAWC